MTEKNEKQNIPVEMSSQEMDQINIDDNVIAIIAGIATTRVEGVVSKGGNVVGNLAERIGKKDISKGVKVETTGDTVNINVSVYVKFGTKIHEVAESVQKEVRDSVQSMTGMNVPSVTVNVQGVEFEDSLKEE